MQRAAREVLPLIVLGEDNSELRHLLAAALERSGYRVQQVETGIALVAAVQQLVGLGEMIHLIITDVRMPMGNGLDAGRAVRDAGLSIPMIFMTAYGDAWTRSRAAELGALLLDKPLSLGALRQAVRKVIPS